MEPAGSPLLQAAGGLGLFLLELSLMGEGLRSLAGNRLRQTFTALLLRLQRGLQPPQPRGSEAAVEPLALLQSDLDRLELYLDQIQLQGQGDGLSGRLVHLLHGLDHLQRLHERCEEEPERLHALATCDALTRERRQQQVEPFLRQVLAEVARGDLDVDEGTRRLEAMRWLNRVSNHLLRISHHLSRAVD